MPRKAAERKQEQEAPVSAPVTVVIEPTQEQRARMDRLLGSTQPKAEIVPFNSAAKDALVSPTVTAEEAKARWDDYTALCRAVLDEGDYTYYACSKKPDGWDAKPLAFRTRKAAEDQLEKWGKARHTELLVRETKKRSAWDKLAKFYSISTPIESVTLCATAEVVEVGDFIVEKLLGDSFKIFVYQDKATLGVVKVSVLLRVVSPNGRTILGDGACAANERKNGADSFAHADHDIFSTAFTRAFNRGVSRCIGTGEVSSEEFESSAPEPQASTIAAAPAQQIPTEAPKAISQPAAAKHPADESSNGGYRIGDVTLTDPKVVSAAEKVAAEVKQTNDALFGKAQEPIAGSLPPKAEIPSMEEVATSAKQQTLPVEETKTDLPKEAAPATASPSTQGVAVPEKFAPLGETATLPSRIYAMKKFLFGKEDSDHRLVELLFFAIEPQIAKPIEILSGNKLQPNKWQAAMKELADRKSRMEVLEKMLSKMGRDNFVEWGEAICKAARAKKLF